MMNSDELCKLADQMQLPEVKNLTIRIPITDILTTNSLANVLYCKIVTNQELDMKLVRNALPKIWNLHSSVKVTEVGRNIFLCMFKSFGEKRGILDK